MNDQVTAHYVALGDSMSIDLYPRLDLQGQGRVLEPEPDGSGAREPGSDDSGVGAASLFHRNHDELWPEFRGRDLSTLRPGIRKLDACVDGATIGHTATLQLPGIPAGVRESATVVTLTAGGNDLLGGLFDGIAGLHDATHDAITGYGELVDAVLDTFPNATLLLTTVYDPTDGTGILPGISDQLGAALPMEHLDTFNDAVRRLAAHTPRAALADVHRHFLGHGLPAPRTELWYWPISPIEPGARGAHEIRRLWLDAMDVMR